MENPQNNERENPFCKYMYIYRYNLNLVKSQTNISIRFIIARLSFKTIHTKTIDQGLLIPAGIPYSITLTSVQFPITYHMSSIRVNSI